MDKNIEIISNNRKAFHSYTIIDRYEAGMVLLGSEVKSLREKKLNLKDSFVTIRDNKVFLIGAHISRYSHTGFEGHEPVRERRLLIHKREIGKIKISLEQKGLTAVPLKIYFNSNGWAKLEIGIAKGKKIYDKKKAIRERDIQREAERELRNR